MICASLYSLDAYAYDLPEDLIAQYPLKDRQASRLMVLDRNSGRIKHDIFKNLGRYLAQETVFVANNSKVVPARLIGRRASGAEVEVFLLNDLQDGYCFEALLRPLKKIREGEPIAFAPGISAVLVDKSKRVVRFSQKNIVRHLQDIGHMPLPPYIKRPDEAGDRKAYQTVYAKHLGSVACPTAGLHFTKALIAGLKRKGHAFKELTLHINYGTFKPVESADIRQHPMHSEGYKFLGPVYQSILKAKGQGRSITAVGTTSARVLESVAHSGKLEGETNIFIYPGHEFKLVDHLITNFHLPYSTLLMLVCAFGGYDLVKRAYRQAIQEKYRFYSYGDAMLLV